MFDGESFTSLKLCKPVDAVLWIRKTGKRSIPAILYFLSEAHVCFWYMAWNMSSNSLYIGPCPLTVCWTPLSWEFCLLSCNNKDYLGSVLTHLSALTSFKIYIFCRAQGLLFYYPPFGLGSLLDTRMRGLTVVSK